MMPAVTGRSGRPPERCHRDRRLSPARALTRQAAAARTNTARPDSGPLRKSPDTFCGAAQQCGRVPPPRESAERLNQLSRVLTSLSAITWPHPAAGVKPWASAHKQTETSIPREQHKRQKTGWRPASRRTDVPAAIAATTKASKKHEHDFWEARRRLPPAEGGEGAGNGRCRGGTAGAGKLA